jgi:hypothetical protein
MESDLSLIILKIDKYLGNGLVEYKIVFFEIVKKLFRSFILA